MDTAFIRRLADGTEIGSGPVPFARLPMLGEFLYVPPDFYRVAEVIHFWTETGDPLVEIRLEPAADAIMAVSFERL